MMARATLPHSVVDALKGAGATEEMIAAAAGAFGAWENIPRAKAAARQRAFRARKRNVTRDAPQRAVAPRDVTLNGLNLRTLLIDASNANINALADISPIRGFPLMPSRPATFAWSCAALYCNLRLIQRHETREAR
jgi:hypothetical protein